MKGIIKHFAVQFIASALGLLVLGGGYLFLRPHLGARGPAVKAAPPEVEHAMVELEEFVINLADTDRARYVKVTLALEVTDDKTAEHINKKMLPRVRDAIIMAMSKQCFRVINTAEGKVALKHELVAAINRALPKVGGKVTDILFTSLVMQ